MESAPPHPDQLFHIRTVFGVVVGLSIAHLLAGLARLVQHPGQTKIYPVHIGWVIFLFTAVLHFWWFEFRLSYVQRWTFEHYLFITLYAALYYFLCSLLFPDKMGKYAGFSDYFHSRQKWFYGLLASLFAIDVIDTFWKGTEHFHALGPEYPIRQALMCMAAIIAMFIRQQWFHMVLVIVMLIAQFHWILSYLQVLS